MEKGMATHISTVKDHFARVWNMWEGMIRVIPDDEWTKGDIDYLIPARHLVHVLVFADSFTGDVPFDQYDPTELFGGGSWGMSPQELPSKETALAKLADIRATVEERLAKLDDAALLEPEKMHPWTGQTRMGKMFYMLRHIQHHLGEVNAELCRRRIEGPRWN